MTEPAPVVERTTRLTPRTRALAILAGVLVMLVVLLFLLTAGGDDEVAGPQPRPTGPVLPRPGATATATERPPPETEEAFEGKDPFEPLVVAPVTTGGDGGIPGDGGAGTGDPGSGDAGTGTGSTPGEDGIAGGTDGEEAHRVTLLDVYRDDGKRFATVDVDGEEFAVAEGETFADSFRLLDLTSKCGTFVFGDERFTLCLGQEVVK